jgi:hypothetical protein
MCWALDEGSSLKACCVAVAGEARARGRGAIPAEGTARTPTGSAAYSQVPDSSYSSFVCAYASVHAAIQCTKTLWIFISVQAYILRIFMMMHIYCAHTCAISDGPCSAMLVTENMIWVAGAEALASLETLLLRSMCQVTAGITRCVDSSHFYTFIPSKTKSRRCIIDCLTSLCFDMKHTCIGTFAYVYIPPNPQPRFSLSLSPLELTQCLTVQNAHNAAQRDSSYDKKGVYQPILMAVFTVYSKP